MGLIRLDTDEVKREMTWVSVCRMSALTLTEGKVYEYVSVPRKRGGYRSCCDWARRASARVCCTQDCPAAAASLPRSRCSARARVRHLSGATTARHPVRAPRGKGRFLPIGRVRCGEEGSGDNSGESPIGMGDWNWAMSIALLRRRKTFQGLLLSTCIRNLYWVINKWYQSLEK